MEMRLPDRPNQVAESAPAMAKPVPASRCRECQDAVDALVGPEPPHDTDEEMQLAVRWSREYWTLVEARHLIHRKAPSWLPAAPRPVGPDR